ncbi:MAG: bifunctional oligoribonuclease/PAP phosphatase NrnA [Sulfurimonas sp.]|nr:bifunctional oligoribonuclease/PAP phosphatase NrnA [Sulfurimonas sp.]
MNEILTRIEQTQHVVLISHLNPDADSLGAASVLYTHMLRLHKKVSWFCATKNIDQKLLFLPWSEKIRSSFPTSADLAISLDCGSRDRLGVAVACDLINIDHHASNEEFGKYNLVDLKCISTTEILYKLFRDNNITINPKMATAIYAGLLDDSGGFLDEKVDGTLFALVKELIEMGADYKLCNKYIMKYQTLGAFRLKAIMHKNMELFCDGRVAVFCVTNEDMKISGAIGSDCESTLEEALWLPSVEVSFLLKQNRDLSIKCSLRSSSKVDVNAIASTFLGGGHASRAGFTLESGIALESAKEKILKLICKEL